VGVIVGLAALVAVDPAAAVGGTDAVAVTAIGLPVVGIALNVAAMTVPACSSTVRVGLEAGRLHASMARRMTVPARARLLFFMIPLICWI
jgi:hypothetical protein